MASSGSKWDEMGFGPFAVTEIRHYVHPMKDNTNIAMKLWLPIKIDRVPLNFSTFFSHKTNGFCKEIYSGDNERTKGEDEQFASILEFLPYCKDHWTAGRDHSRHAWFCSWGFVCVRADLRGSGSSSGYYFDEYELQEQEDGVEIIEWLATQPWSNGNVGMYGKSWGGFNGLQIAYRRPPALKAVISLYSTDDRYSDDVHYMGGCVLGNGMLPWAANMFAWNARPPHPRYFSDEDKWRQFWLDRLQCSAKPCTKIWLSHQVRTDPYWANGSINEDISRVQCPILVIGGLVDGYVNAAFRMAANLNTASKAIIGPWGHDWPDVSRPGPRIDYLGLCLQWWNFHLKGILNCSDIGAPEWPRLQLFVREPIKPGLFYDEFPGTWIAISNWSSLYEAYEKNILMINENKKVNDNILQYFLHSDAILREQPMTGKADVVLTAQAFQGANSGEWYATVNEELPGDQNLSNECSACWYTYALEKDLVIAGFSMALLNLESTKDTKCGIAVRLCDVWPSGEVTRISYGILHLAKWCGQDKPASSFPGKRELIVRIQLNATGQIVKAGHKLCLAVSKSYFPVMFPFPEKGEEVKLHLSGSKLLLQTLTSKECENKISLKPPRPLLNLESVEVRPQEFEPSNFNPIVEGRLVLFHSTHTTGRHLYPTLNVCYGMDSHDCYKTDLNVTFGQTTSDRTVEMEFPENKLSVKISTKSDMHGKIDTFNLTEDLGIKVNNEQFFSRKWETTIPRDFV